MRVIELSGEERINLIAPSREVLSPWEVLELLDPVDPDNLLHLGGGVYEARWMDAWVAAREIVQLCGRRERLCVLSERPERPDGLPTWVSVQFCVLPLPVQYSDLVQ